jgi:hypothetical protein
MIGETYELSNSPDLHVFTFFSEGEKGRIQKVIIYSIIQENLYNLAFGDFVNGELDDAVISNNADLVKVMNTVVKSVYLFIEEYPDRAIYIEPVDRKRSVLYHAIFSRRYDEITAIFEVTALNEKKQWVPFESGKSYLAFQVERKSTIK